MHSFKGVTTTKVRIFPFGGGNTVVVSADIVSDTQIKLTMPAGVGREIGYQNPQFAVSIRCI